MKKSSLKTPYLIIFGLFSYFMIQSKEAPLHPKRVDSSMKLNKTLIGHNNKINAIACTSDNKYIVSGSWDGTVIIWDNLTGNVKYRLGSNRPAETHYITCLAIDSDNKYVVTGSSDHTATIWEINSGKKEQTLVGHNDFILSSSFSKGKEDSFILTSSYDFSAIIWELSGKIRHKLKHPEAVEISKISNDSKFVVTTSKNIAYIWDSKTGLCKHQLPNNGKISSLEISHDDNYIIIGDSKGNLVKWESQTGKPIYTVNLHVGSLMALSLSIDGKYIISGSTDLYTCITDFDSGNLLNKFYEGFWVVSSAISADSKYVLTSGNSACLRHLDTGKVIKEFKNPEHFITHVNFYANNDFILVMKEKAQLYNLLNNQDNN